MKLVFVGGGSLRILGIARSILAVPGLMTDGEIRLYDLAHTRFEAMGRMLQNVPVCQEDARILQRTDPDLRGRDRRTSAQCGRLPVMHGT